MKFKVTFEEGYYRTPGIEFTKLSFFSKGNGYILEDMEEIENLEIGGVYSPEYGQTVVRIS